MSYRALAADFMDIFAGAERSHGTYGATDSAPGSPKVEIKKTAVTKREPVTLELWAQHLAGTCPLGVVPIREDDTCLWGAVDIDKYDISIAGIAQELEKLSIPALVCRTKSGGAHIFLFFAEPIAARDVMAKLREIAAVLGHGDSEIFPKQETVLLDRGDLGSWLNMPYFGGDTTERYGVRADNRGYSPEDFVTRARALRLTREGLKALRPTRSAAPGFSSGPPCLETLTQRGFGAGSRNNGLFALGVLAKKQKPDDWENLIEQWNREFMQPPLPSDEVTAVIRSLRRKDYDYRCKDQPIASCCNVALCRTRPHGVGAGAATTIIESVSVLGEEDPLYFVYLKTGGTVECSAGVLLSPKEFQVVALKQLSIVLPLFKTDEWGKQVGSAMENATKIEMPREVSTRGRFEELLQNFCTDRYRAEKREEILLGRPWLDERAGMVWFRLEHLEKHLVREKFLSYTRQILSARLRDLGGSYKQLSIRGAPFWCWTIAADQFQWHGEAEVPRAEAGPL